MTTRIYTIMGGQFTPTDPVRCPHYAQFASRLDRIHFDGIYWTFFFLVIGILFVSSWIYQSYVANGGRYP